MQINCFIVKRPLNNSTDIKVLYNEFGNDVPKYSPLEGGDYLGPEYLCCVDATIDIKSICDKYGYIIRRSYNMNIDPLQYNSKYKIYINYSSSNIYAEGYSVIKSEHPYKLEPIDFI